MDESILQALKDQQDIITVINAVATTADRKDWKGCRACFTDEIFLDHDASSHSPQKERADDVIASWEKIFEGFASTLHFVTNHEIQVNGNAGRCRSFVQAIHVAANPEPGENFYHVFGTYDDELVRSEDGWKIATRTYHQLYAVGNPRIFREPTINQ